MTPLDFLLTRRSIPARHLGAPGPDAAQLAQLLSLAMRVPDHGRLAPWRFVLLEGEARREFGRRLAALHLERDPDLPERKRSKDQDRYEHAPLVVVVIVKPNPEHPGVPLGEQRISAAYAAYNLLLGAGAMGFGAQLLTGWATSDAGVAALLDLEPPEEILGFVHIGTPIGEAPERRPPDMDGRVLHWQP